MRRVARWVGTGTFILSLGMSFGGVLAAQETPAVRAPEKTPWLEPVPTPADPELEEQIVEVQNALSTIHRQTVRRKELLDKTQDAEGKLKLHNELDLLRKERNILESLLHDLVDEAKASERTAIDEALERARWLELQEHYDELKEEAIRDRQE